MASTANRLVEFGPLTDGHAISAELAALLACAAADPVLVSGGADAAGPVEVRRNLRVAVDASGGHAITSFYWCAKWRDAAGEFHARLFLHDPACGPAATYDFPADPRLPAAAADRGPLDARDVSVLRYIPTRRITFRRGEAVVGKLKRRGTVKRSYAILRAVHAASGSATFGIPEPLGVDPARDVFYQQRMPGRSVAELIDADNAPALLRRVGALHAAVHTLEVEDVRVRATADDVAAVRAHARWIAFVLPAHADAIGAAERRTVAALDSLTARAPAFCHGDPALDQVLLDGDACAIVDFDDSALGDPYADLAAMVAGLAIDARGLSRGTGAAEAAYLDGYREASGRPLDERRLDAHLRRARLARLASRLCKGRLSTPEAEAAVAELA
jgi:aminoglycoside phosphotransferase (APT) family kinase protein